MAGQTHCKYLNHHPNAPRKNRGRVSAILVYHVFDKKDAKTNKQRLSQYLHLTAQLPAIGASLSHTPSHTRSLSASVTTARRELRTAIFDVQTCIDETCMRRAQNATVAAAMTAAEPWALARLAAQTRTPSSSTSPNSSSSSSSNSISNSISNISSSSASSDAPAADDASASVPPPASDEEVVWRQVALIGAKADWLRDARDREPQVCVEALARSDGWKRIIATKMSKV